jgi:hypothetical protein
MATWQQVKSYIYANYTVANDDGQVLPMHFETETGRSQMVLVSFIEAEVFSSVIFQSPIAEWSQVSADRVLRATENMSVGVRSIGDYIVAHHSQLVASIDEAEIELPHDADRQSG